jgi:hypothetical protein
MAIAKVRERLAVSKQETEKFDVERFDLKNLSELDVMKHYHIQFSISFEALGNLSDSENINRAWENVKECIRISAKKSLGLYEMKQHKP